MSISVTGKLNQDARQFEAGESTGFSIRVGSKSYNSKTKETEWTNYEAAFFLRNEGQINYHRDTLVKGAIVEVSGSGLRINQYEGSNGTQISLAILDPRLGFTLRPSETEDDIPF
jgi:single-strand DNA-binding protein